MPFGIVLTVDYDLGQTFLSFVGTLETKGTMDEDAFEEEGLTGSEKDKGDKKLHARNSSRKSTLKTRAMSMLKQRASSFRKQTDGEEGGSGNIKNIVTSVKALLVDVIEKQFHQPDVIDARRIIFFIEVTMRKSPPLTAEENGIIESVRKYEKALATMGKRVKGNIRERQGVDKFHWREGDQEWGGFEVKVDKAAEGVLAYIMEVRMETIKDGIDKLVSLV